VFVLDTCVLYPTIVRNILLNLAMVDEYQAVWSEKILDEWLCSSSKQGYISQESAKIEIMQVNLRFPNSMQPLKNFETEEYWLPDFNDIHVLALAIQTASEGIITFNKKDFPNKILNNHNLFSITPDQFITSIYSNKPDLVLEICNQELQKLNGTLREPLKLKSLLKKAQLPKLSKILS